MKNFVKCSLLMNVILLGGMIFALRHGKNGASSSSPAATLASQSAAREAQPVPSPAAAHAEPAPFRWSQLAVEDYHQYVKNLRDAGCPELTVRAIVAADVHAVFSQRSRVLEQQLAEMATASWSVQLGNINAEAEVRAEMQGLPDAEAARVADLLGLKLKPTLMAAGNGAPTNRFSGGRKNWAERPVSLPLAVQDIDLAGMKLSEEQKQAIAQVREDFLAQIGGTNQDPNDLAYRQRWQQAQPDADNMLMSLLGNAAYNEYQLKAQLGRQEAAAMAGQ